MQARPGVFAIRHNDSFLWLSPGRYRCREWTDDRPSAAPRVFGKEAQGGVGPARESAHLPSLAGAAFGLGNVTRAFSPAVTVTAPVSVTVRPPFHQAARTS